MISKPAPRILTTHAGSLPRPKALVELQLRRSRGEAIDPATYAEATLHATRRAVQKQIECGVDIGNDGEQPRESFVTYLRYRMSGFGGESRRPPVRDLLAYPSFRELVQAPPRANLRAWAWWPRNWCGRSCVRCETAPRSPRGGCSRGIGSPERGREVDGISSI